MRSAAVSRWRSWLRFTVSAVANIIFLPVANKLKARAKEAVHVREMMLQGVLSIAEGSESEADTHATGSLLAAAGCLGQRRRKPKTGARTAPASAQS